jgi:Uma2 family endonuclease
LKLVRPADGVEIDLLPLQGLWTESQYLKLTNQLNHLVEFSDGRIEVLPMPTSRHQAMLLWLYEQFKAAVRNSGGKVLVAPLRLQVRPGKFREPDILMLFDPADARYQDAFWLGADLVVEIVSPDNPERDLEDKPRDYAEASIPEYWIVNPIDDSISVLVLEGARYRVHGVFRRGEWATSRYLTGFSVDVSEVLDAG